MDEDDAALLAAVCEGSDRAFNALIDRHQQAVRLFLRGLVSGLEDADDIAQETFLAVWRHGRAYKGRGSVRAWMFSIAWRKAKDAQRLGFRRRRREAAYRELASGGSPATDDAIALEQAMATLSLDQRAAVVLCLGCGFTAAEAAEALGQPVGTVKSHVSRGRARLAEALGVQS